MAFYDQGFKVELDNGQRLVANFRYSLKEYVSSDPLSLGVKNDKGLKDLATDDYNKFYSQCDKTMVGFVQTPGGSMKNH